MQAGSLFRTYNADTYFLFDKQNPKTMERISIISTNGEIRIEAELPKETVDQPVFSFTTAEYMIEITQAEDSMHVSNAMNGYGQNVRDDFKDALIEVFV